jgi:rare lipoprotein A
MRPRFLFLGMALAVLAGCASQPHVGEKSTMTASWYGADFNGRQTANGEIYDMNAMTAAHKELPFNTKLRVTYLKTGKSVVVRINDRGPFIMGRDLDLSAAAAERLGMVPEGVGKVRVEVVGIDSMEDDVEPVAVRKPAPEPPPSPAVGKASDTPPPVPKLVPPPSPPSKPYYVETGAFAWLTGAEKVRQSFPGLETRIKFVNKGGSTAYAVRAGGFSSEQEANACAELFRAKGIEVTVRRDSADSL